MKKSGAVYILTNQNNTTLYTGVTSDLKRRINAHKEKTDTRSFTARYYLNKFVYYEGFRRIEDAIFREKQIKAGSKAKKEKLINSINPEWKDLYDEVLLW
ncbi:MAG TPA: GIY-YIG nuclease family protein [Bacteroidia bacterium]|jgi:putative endonuclease|nr:GIY-YIG nuclease family protein [Bacteroidia bacterium]